MSPCSTTPPTSPCSTTRATSATCSPSSRRAGATEDSGRHAPKGKQMYGHRFVTIAVVIFLQFFVSCGRFKIMDSILAAPGGGAAAATAQAPRKACAYRAHPRSFCIQVEWDTLSRDQPTHPQSQGCASPPQRAQQTPHSRAPAASSIFVPAASSPSPSHVFSLATSQGVRTGRGSTTCLSGTRRLRPTRST